MRHFLTKKHFMNIFLNYTIRMTLYTQYAGMLNIILINFVIALTADFQKLISSIYYFCGGRVVGIDF